jgi:tetratricopeptide (TPR) repeat protein
MTAIENILEQQWNFQEPAKSEEVFQVLLTQEPKHKAEILTQIARAQGLQNKFDQAHATLDEVEHLPIDEQVHLRYLLERGRVFKTAGEKAKARPLFLEALELAKQIKADFYAVDAAHMLAIIEPLEQQLHWHEVAVDLCEQSHDERTRGWLGSLYNNLGWTYQGQENYQAALEIFQKALEVRLTQNKPQQIIIAKWCVARTLRSLARYQEALDIQLALEQELESRAEPDGYVYEELAECLHLLGKTDEATHYFALAYQELSKDTWLRENEKERLERLKHLSTA